MNQWEEAKVCKNSTNHNSLLIDCVAYKHSVTIPMATERTNNTHYPLLMDEFLSHRTSLEIAIEFFYRYYSNNSSEHCWTLQKHHQISNHIAKIKPLFIPS